MIIMKRENKISYVSPDGEIIAVACEQAIMSASGPASLEGTGNEAFEDGGKYEGGWM